MSSVHAIYENGVFRPLSPVKLPDHCEVEFDPKVVQTPLPIPTDAGLDRIYAILGDSVETGDADLAARHNEHQP